MHVFVSANINSRHQAIGKTVKESTYNFSSLAWGSETSQCYDYNANIKMQIQGKVIK